MRPRSIHTLTGFGDPDGDISDSLYCRKEGRHVTAFKSVELATVLEGREHEPGSEGKSGPAPTDIEGPCDQLKHEHELVGQIET